MLNISNAHVRGKKMEEEKKASAGVLWLDDIMQKIIGNSGKCKVIKNRLTFVVFNPEADYKSVKKSLEVIINGIDFAIEEEEKKKSKNTTKKEE